VGLAAAQERILTLGQLDARGRLAAFLLAMARRKTRAQSPCLAFEALVSEALVAELPMSRIDVADYLGLTVETVSRVFTALRGLGAIRLATANRVEILDPPALAMASTGTVESGGAIPLRRCA
jgi:CRP-like cAMP-binding protein